MIDSLALQDRLDVTSVEPARSSEISGWTLTPALIVSKTPPKNDRRAEVLAAAYRYILSAGWGRE